MVRALTLAPGCARLGIGDNRLMSRAPAEDDAFLEVATNSLLGAVYWC